MTLFPGWKEGPCLVKGPETGTFVHKGDLTQEECEEHCKLTKRVKGQTGCQYDVSTEIIKCSVFTNPIFHERLRGSLYRCQIFAEKNDDEGKKTLPGKPNTPGRLTKPYKTNPNHLLY